MEPFLKKIARTFYRKYGTAITRLAFVFPNRRSGIFFQKYLAEEAGKAMFSPHITTINDLMGELSPYRKIDRIALLFMLYRIYKERKNSDEPFDDFVFWGEMLLNDFDDVDKYMVDAAQLFTNIHDLKEIDEFYLTEEQIEVIKRFWGHFFFPDTNSPQKQEFISLWEILYPLYDDLRSELKQQGLAYEGMIFRDVAERAKANEAFDLPYEQVVFIGFNAITEAERVLMKQLQRSGIGDFYWDYFAPTLFQNGKPDRYNRAVYFLEDNMRLFPSKLDIGESVLQSRPEIELFAIPSAIGQAKQSMAILNELIASGDIPQPDKALNTAIVLPDEELLMPVLYSIPEEIDPINVTMGYTLQHTPIAALMDAIYQMQRHIRYQKGEALFYHLEVKQLLSHRLVARMLGSTALETIEYINRNNRIYIQKSELQRHPFMDVLFRAVTPADASGYLLDILEFLQKENREEDTDENDPACGFSQVEREFIYHYYITVRRLNDVIASHGMEMDVSTYFRLLSKMTAGISIPFRGEPLSGLQVMGVLETRALDFENLIILSMNEDIFPVKKVAGTFIPYNLRRGFGMATTEHQDSIYAYYFYRMISRAKRVFLLYDSRTEGLQSGEMSRYVYQLKYHYRYEIHEKVLSYNIGTEKPLTLQIGKTDEIMRKLNERLSGGERHLSASAINTYLNCPLQFYFQEVEGIGNEDEVNENIDSSTFGTIYHNIMRHIYNRMKGECDRVTVTSDMIDAVLKDKELLTSFIEREYAENFFKRKHPETLTGKDYMVAEIIRKYVRKTLSEDKRNTPFTYLESEKLLDEEMPFGNAGQRVRIKGYIDRVEEKNGVVRIIDYKTGKDKSNFPSVESLFDKSRSERNKAVMQVFLYCAVYQQEKGYEMPIQGFIYGLRSLFDHFKPIIQMGQTEITDFNRLKDEFMQELDRCLCEIFDPNTAFTQTEVGKHCLYCNFKNICKR